MRIVTCGVDWLTMTVRAGETLAGVDELWQELQGMRYDQGHPVKDFKFQQYTGVEIGDFQRAYDATHGIFIAQGCAAQIAIERLPDIRFNGNITRCDVKADVQGSKRAVWQPEKFDAKYMATLAAKGLTGKRRSGVTRGADGGITASIGARESDDYFRCYRSDIKHPDEFFEPTVRFERELHGERARAAYEKLVTSPKPREVALSLVVGRLTKLGLTQPWCKGVAPDSVRLKKPKTSYGKSLDWLRNDVRGTVKTLMDAGLHYDVEEALGLPFGSLAGDS